MHGRVAGRDLNAFCEATAKPEFTPTLSELAEPELAWDALTSMSSKGKPYNEATRVSAENGEVILDGPDGVDVRLTPEAAEETSENLLEGAAMAAGQRKLDDLPHKPE